MFVIPAIDILNEKTARLIKGNFNQAIYYDLTPLEYAVIFKCEGFKRIHIVDLMASKTGQLTTLKIVEKIKNETKLTIQFGGGIRRLEDADRVFEAGADKIVIGSISVINKPEFEKIVAKYNDDRIIAAADFKDEKIYIKGWTETGSVSVYEHIQYCMDLGVKEFLCTDISRDGLLGGYGVKTYKLLSQKFPSIKIIASGGASSGKDLKEVQEAGVYAAIVGRAFYENKISLSELKRYA